MSIQYEIRDDKTIFHIHEPTPYGELDRFRTVTVQHDTAYRSHLPAMDRHAAVVKDGYLKFEFYEVPNVGTLVFRIRNDRDWCSWAYRAGHEIDCPFLLVDSIIDSNDR